MFGGDRYPPRRICVERRFPGVALHGHVCVFAVCPNPPAAEAEARIGAGGDCEGVSQTFQSSRHGQVPLIMSATTAMMTDRTANTVLATVIQ